MPETAPQYVVTASTVITTVITVEEPCGPLQMREAADKALAVQAKFEGDENTVVDCQFFPGKDASGDDKPARKKGALTRRQSEIFHLLAEGKSNRQIAIDIGISEHTVRVHMTAILRGLGVANRTQAAVMAAAQRSTAVRQEAAE